MQLTSTNHRPFPVTTPAGVSLLFACVIILRSAVTSAAVTTDPRGIGPSILRSNSEDDIIVSSGHAWGSGSGHLPFDGYVVDQEDEEEDIPSTKATLLKLVTPDSARMSCIVCTTVGDRSCRDPYIRNASHIQTCQTSVEGCLKVVTPSGDTYRNCLYGIFATAEKTTGCRVVKEDEHVGHKFVNATICICQTNECNSFFYTPTPTMESRGSSRKGTVSTTSRDGLTTVKGHFATKSTDIPPKSSAAASPRLKYSLTYFIIISAAVIRRSYC